MCFHLFPGRDIAWRGTIGSDSTIEFLLLRLAELRHRLLGRNPVPNGLKQLNTLVEAERIYCGKGAREIHLNISGPERVKSILQRLDMYSNLIDQTYSFTFS